MKTLEINELILKYQCKVYGNHNEQNLSFIGIRPLSDATNEHISFLTNNKYLHEVGVTKAGLILCTEKDALKISELYKGLILICADPYVVFARISQYFFMPIQDFNDNISDKAWVDTSAMIATSAIIYPFAFIGTGAKIGERTIVYPGVFVGSGAVIGNDCLLYPNSVVREACVLGDRCILNPGAVIGGDGFGFAPTKVENVKIIQSGNVVLDNDVEVGSNSSIDRATFGHTYVAEQTKIDSLVQIGHNVEIGKKCILCGMVGIAGSVKIGNNVTLAGQVGMAGHLSVGDNVTVLGQSGITKNLEANNVYFGSPAKPAREYLRQMAMLNKLLEEKK